MLLDLKTASILVSFGLKRIIGRESSGQYRALSTWTILLENASLTGTNGDHFTYDTTWGGLVTINAMNDHAADFGQVSSILEEQRLTGACV